MGKEIASFRILLVCEIYYCSTMVVSQDKTLRNGYGQKNLMREPLKLKGLLDKYKSFEVTPVIGKEFPDANVVEWMKAPNSDDLLRDLAILSTYPNLLFDSQRNISNEL